MLSRLYAKWMFSWETALTTRDTNRIVRPLEWGFDWLNDFSPLAQAEPSPAEPADNPRDLERMIAVNEDIVHRADDFFGYQTPTDFRLERRHPQLFPTNVRPETLAQDAELKLQAAVGELEEADFLRFTSPTPTRYPENDIVNARWYPAPPEKQQGKPKQAIIVMPQWNADAFSHNALCTLFNRFGISALRLSKPYHDIRRPAELERSDYAVSSNIGRTYAFIAAAFDPRLQVCAFNHASTWFGDVVWTGQSTRHIRAAFEDAGLTQDLIRQIFTGVSPMAHMERFAANPRQVLVVHATYDLTFLREFSLDVLANFDHHNVDYVSKVLPCGHYTTGETPYKYIDGWYLGSFVYKAFKHLAESTTATKPGAPSSRQSH